MSERAIYDIYIYIYIYIWDYEYLLIDTPFHFFRGYIKS